MSPTENKRLLVRQAKAVCRALGTDQKAALEIAGKSPINAVLMLQLPVFLDAFRPIMVCRFSRFGATANVAIDDCRESLRSYLTTHGLTAGIEAMRVTA
jgi:hypothetical protein